MQELIIIIVCYNEEINLPKLFKSIHLLEKKIAVRKIYIDQSSTDNSLEIAKNNGCEVYIHPNLGYSDPDKKWVLENLCKDENRCLILDGDCELKDDLSKEIVKIIQEDKYEVANIYLKDIFLGGYGIKVLIPLLFKKKAIEITDEIHNHIHIKSKKNITLKNSIVHNDLKLLGKEISVLINKFNRYTDIEIKKIGNILKYKILINLLRKPLQRFFGYGIIHKQFLRGRTGIIHCTMIAHYQFMIYAKLYEKYINKSNKQILNLGCGRGSNIPHLLNKGHITCVDMEQKSLNIAKKKFPQCEYICATGEDMKFSEKFFDEIYCFDVLEHVSNLDITMKNIHTYLKDDGFVYIEIPYDKSEKILTKINPKYPKQIGHQRVFEYKKLQETFTKYNFNTTKISKSRGISHIYLWILFKLGIDISNQLGETSGGKKIIERIVMFITIWFDKNIFNTPLKYIPLWIITLPIGAIISEIFPKTIILILEKNEKISDINS